MSYIAAAQKRWPGRTVFGDGRFAVAAKDGGVVYLAVTAQQQHNIALGIENARKFDLQPTPVPELKDDWEDRRRARRKCLGVQYLRPGRNHGSLFITCSNWPRCEHKEPMLAPVPAPSIAQLE